MLRLDDGVVGKLVQHAGHFIADMIRVVWVMGLVMMVMMGFAGLCSVVSLHQQHLLKFAPLDLLLVCVADTFIHKF